MAKSPETITVQNVELAQTLEDMGKKLIEAGMSVRRGMEVAVDYSAKPWLEAEEGELWALTLEGEEIVFRVDPCPDFQPVLGHKKWATIALGSEKITAGRRIGVED
jgi:hypothetical protein